MRHIRVLALVAALLPFAAGAADQKGSKPPAAPVPGSTPPVAPNPDPPLLALPVDPLSGDFPPLVLPGLKGSKLCIFKFVQRDASLKKSGLMATSLSPETALVNVEQSFLAVAKLSPILRDATLLPSTTNCAVDDDSCLALMGSMSACENVLAGSATKVDNGYATSIRFVNVKKGQTVANASPDQVIQTKDPAQVASWVEAQACRALQVGCSGQARVDMDLPTMQLYVDDKPLPRTGTPIETLKLPVGPHSVVATIGPRRSKEVILPVRLSAANDIALFVRQNAKGEVEAHPRGELLDRNGHATVLPSAKYDPPGRWEKPTGLVVAGVGVLMAAAGVYEGLHSKSLINGAQNNYQTNKTYLPSDLSTLNSAHSAASLGNVLVIGGAIAAAAGLTLAFAF